MGLGASALTDNAGTLTNTYNYDGFGNIELQTGTTVNSYLYRAGQYDVAVGPYYLRARWYRQQTGRFITQDKYEGPVFVRNPCRSSLNALSPTIAINSSYTYSTADPINKLDRSGRDSEDEEAELDLTQSVGKIAQRTGRTPRDIRKAIHVLKRAAHLARQS